MNQHTLQDYAKEFSLTGNAIADTFIITSVASLAFNYFNALTSIFQNILSKIWSIISNFVKYWLRSKISGRTLCIVEIEKFNMLHKALYPVFTDNKYKSEENIKSTFIRLLDYIDNITHENKTEKKSDTTYEDTYYYSFYKYYDKRFEINADYKSDKLLDFSKKNGYDNVKKKIFKHGNYFVKMTLKETSQENSKIEIELLSYEPSNDTEESNIAKIEDFLVKKLDITESIYYTYVIDNEDKYFTKHLTKVVNNGNNNTSSGLLTYGNKYSSKISQLKNEKHENNNYMDNSLIMSFKDHDYSKEDKDYKKDMTIFENNFGHKKRHDESVEGFNQLYKKYVSDQMNVSYTISPSYFIDDNKIYFFIISGNTSKIIIVSFDKRMTCLQIKEKMDWIIKLGVQDNTIDSNIEKDEVYINRREHGQWNKFRLDKRGFETIYLPEAQMKEIKDEIENFTKMEKLYKEFQIPYKKGLLFYGPPGTGKTSVVKSIAYEYQMNIYLVNINSEEVNDDTIVDILNSLGSSQPKILLFEDIDSAFADKEKIKDEQKIEVNENAQQKNTTHTVNKNNKKEGAKSNDTGETIVEKELDVIKTLLDRKDTQPTKTLERKFLTYSGLLQAMDGVMTSSNSLITIMTTNYIEKLGDAFLRPGRIDKCFHLAACNHEQIHLMIFTLLKKKLKIDLNYRKSISTDKNASKSKLSSEITQEEYNREFENYKQQMKLEDKIKQLTNNLCDEKGQSQIKPCELQFYILKYIENVDNIFNNYKELLK